MDHSSVLITRRGPGEWALTAKFLSCQVTFFSPKKAKVKKLRKIDQEGQAVELLINVFVQTA